MTERNDDAPGGGPGSPGDSGSPADSGSSGDSGSSAGGRDPWSWSADQAPGGLGEGGAAPGPGYGAPQPPAAASGPGYGSAGSSSPYAAGEAGPPPAPPYGYGSGYGGSGYGAGYGLPVRQTSTNAVVALVLAIASYPICPIVFAVVALILARTADREIAASGGLKEGAGMVRAARIIAWINIALFGGLVLLFVVLGLAGVIFSGFSVGR